MLDPTALYTVEPEVAAELQARTAAGDGPVLVSVLRGFVDAGSAAQVAEEHLRRSFEPRRLATFDADQLLDYRSRRPLMTFESTTWASYAAPELAVDLVRDAAGVPFLLLHGVEPDVQWERWVAAMRGLVERFDISLTVGLHGIPMGVPHTRPLGVTAHATRAELVAHHRPWLGTVQVPASAASLLELRLGEEGHDAMGFAVHVPHYLAQFTYPRAGMVGLEHLERAAGLSLETHLLTDAVAEADEEVRQQVSASDEVAEVVRALESQYDAFMRGIDAGGLLADGGGLPTAEELGEQVERFLAGLDDGPAGRS